MNADNKQKLVRIVGGLFAVMALLVAGVVYAAIVTVDTFNSGNQTLLTNSLTGTPASGSVSGGSDVLGTYRDAVAAWDSGNNNVDLGVDTGTSPGSNEMSLSIGSGTKGSAEVTWDGDNNASIRSYTLGADLESASPTNTGIYMVILGCDHDTTLKLTGYEDASNYEDQSIDVTGQTDLNRLDIFFPFAGFSATGTGADWGDLGALVLDIDGTIQEDLDITIDYMEATLNIREYGDLPSDYSVVSAYHSDLQALTLGHNLDAESANNASTGADGDDTSDYDDEDGVTPAYYEALPGTYAWGANITVNGCSSTCYLNGWVDWNGDNDFGDSGEHPINNVSGDDTSLSSRRYLNLASSVSAGYYYLRFRVCDSSSECNAPGGNATNGEVEDYRWYMSPTSAEMSAFSAAWDDQDVLVEWQTASEVGLKGFNVWRGGSAVERELKLNAEAIKPLTPGALTGNDYDYLDETAVSANPYYYWIELLHVGDQSTWHGPVEAEEAQSVYHVYLPLIVRSE